MYINLLRLLKVLNMIKIIKCILFLLLVNSISNANIISSLKIEGNSRISNDTIKSLIEFNNNQEYTEENLNQMQKKIFESNFFKNVTLILEKDTLVIKLVENPIINFFYIEGVTYKEREELIYELIEIGQNKIYSDATLKKDMNIIKQIYIDSGFLNVSIEPKITQIDNNNVNLVINIQENKKIKIKNIYFIGEKFFDSSVLTDVISSSVQGWWKFMSNSFVYSQKRIDFDKQLLSNFYLDEGFLNFEILSVDINMISEEFVNLTYSLNAGKKFLYDKIKLVDKDNELNAEHKMQIQQIIDDKLGDSYSHKELIFVENLIKKFLISKKIEFVEIDFRARNKNYETGRTDVEFIVNSEKALYIDTIQILGNSITQEEVIRRSLLFAEGDSFSTFKMRKSKNNLLDLQIFKNIDFSISEKKGGLLDVSITVEEQPTGSISAGVGVGSDGSAIQTALSEKNFNGLGINVNAGVSLGTEKISGSVGFTIPDFKNTDKNLSYKIYAISSDYENSGYESTVIGNSLSTKFTIFENIYFTSGFSFDRDSISTNSSASELYKSRAGDYMTYKTFYNIENDRRNRKFQPSDGYVLSFGQKFAVPGSKITFVENNLYGSAYHQLNQDFTLNFKTSLNSINSLNDSDIKLSDRLFSNSSLIRGFENRGIGPKDGGDHVGGNYSVFSSVSSTFPNILPDKWNAKTIIFLDAGNVWGVDYDSNLDSNSIRASTGLSLDWLSPLGPLNLTFAKSLKSQTGDIEESFSFNLGSQF